MKKVTYLLFFTMLLASCQKNSFHITGDVAGIKDGMIYLQEIKDNKLAKTDSATVKDGHFEFEGAVKYSTRMYIGPTGAKPKNIMLYVDNSDITVTGDLNSNQKVIIEGSASQDLANTLNEEQKVIQDKLQPLIKAYHKEKDPEKKNKIREEAVSLSNQGVKNQIKFVEDHMDSHVSVYMTAYDLRGQIEFEKLEKMTEAFEKQFPGSDVVKILSDKIAKEKKTAIGQKAPDFSVKDINGNTVTLDSFKGKYVLLDFWASWCGPCRREAPNFVKIYNKYKDKNFEIFGISLDKEEAKWKNGIKDMHFTWNHTCDFKVWKAEVARLYNVNSIPTCYLIGPDGVIIAKGIVGEELDKKLDSLLN